MTTNHANERQLTLSFGLTNAHAKDYGLAGQPRDLTWVITSWLRKRGLDPQDPTAFMGALETLMAIVRNESDHSCVRLHAGTNGPGIDLTANHTRAWYVLSHRIDVPGWAPVDLRDWKPLKTWAAYSGTSARPAAPRKEARCADLRSERSKASDQGADDEKRRLQAYRGGRNQAAHELRSMIVEASKTNAGFAAFVGADKKALNAALRSAECRVVPLPLLAPLPPAEAGASNTGSNPAATPRTLDLMTGFPGAPDHPLFGKESWVDRLLHHLLVAGPGVGLCGMGGIGKSAAAARTAYHGIESGRFERAHWLSAARPTLFGEAPGRTLNSLNYASIVRFLTEQIGDLDALEADLATQETRVRAVLSQSPQLVIADNLETATEEQDRIAERLGHLLEGGASRFLMTSRRPGFPCGEKRISPLDRVSSGEMIRALARERRHRALAEADDDLIAKVFPKTGGLPLALRLVVGVFATEKLPIDRVLARLNDIDPTRDDPDDEYQKFYVHVFQHAERHLGPAEREILEMLVNSPGGEDLEMLEEALAPRPSVEVDRALGRLTRLSLVDTEQSGLDGARYSLHPITRRFCGHRLGLQFLADPDGDA